MTTYTVQIEAHGTDDIWQALAPAETIEHDGDAEQVAADVDANQTVADGHGYRILVWHGADADTSSTPAVDYRPAARGAGSVDEIADEGTLLDEGAEIAERLRQAEEDVKDVRGELDAWMRKAVRSGLPKSRIAEAVGSSRQTVHTAMTR